MNRVLNNWRLKLISIILAIGLWSHVRGEVNPWETASFRVPLQSAPPSRLLVLNRDKIPREVRVTLRAPRARLREMKGFTPPNPLAPTEEAPLLSTGDVRASLDFSLARLGTVGAQDVPVRASADVEDAEVIGVKPSFVVALFERAQQQQLAIELKTLPARGYRIENARLDRSAAILFGPARALSQVHILRAQLRSGPLSLNASRGVAVELEALDQAGHAVPEVSIEPRRAQVTAVLREETLEKEVTLEARFQNLPSSTSASASAGVAVGEAEATPARVRVRGPLLEVEKIGSLRLNVDAEGTPIKNGWLQRRVQLDLPPRVSVVGDPQVLVRARAR